MLCIEYCYLINKENLSNVQSTCEFFLYQNTSKEQIGYNMYISSEVHEI